MTENIIENPNTEQYLTALTSLAKNITDSTQKIVDLYQQQNLALEPEGFIRLYCYWLGSILDQRINADKVHLEKLIIDTIQDNTEQGRNLCRLVNQHNGENTKPLDELVTTHGLIIVPVLKISQFISSAIKKMFSADPRPAIAKDNIQLDPLFEQQLQEIFEQTYQSAVTEINALEIANPLIFFLEHFSIILGWLAGFFAQLGNKSTHDFLKKGLRTLKNSIHDGQKEADIKVAH